MRGGTFFPLVVATVAASLLLSVAFREFEILVPMVLALAVVGLASNSLR